MQRITITKLRTKVDELNKEYGLSDNSPCKLEVLYAYGGYQVILRVNQPFGNFAYPITIGFYPAKDTYSYLIYEDMYLGLSAKIDKISRELIESYNRRHR